MAISTQVNNDLYKRALSDADKKLLAQIVKTQGAGAASSAYLASQNAAQGDAVTPTVSPGIGGETVAPTGGAVNGPIGPTAMRRQAKGLQNAGQVLTSGNVSAINNFKISQAKQNNPFKAAVAAATPSSGNPAGAVSPSTVQQKDYLIFGDSNPDFKVGMDDYERSKWDAISQKYAAGDNSWLMDTNDFRNAGNWSGYYDDSGNYNGWLRPVNGIGGYAPVFGGKIGETGYEPGTVFYGPDGIAYTMGADGSLTKSGTVDVHKYGSYIGPKAGYQDSTFWRLEDGQYKKYTTQTAPDDVLEEAGYYRDANGLVMPISTNENYWTQKAIKNGEITPEQAVMAQAIKTARENGNLRYTPSGKQGTPPNVYTEETITDTQSYPGTPRPQENTPDGTTPTNTTPTGTAPTGTTPTGATGTTPAASGNPYQAYLDQWDYAPAPEWGGSDYESKRDAALEAAGERWGGSEYQQRRDEALRRAEDMEWNYNPDTDPVWQAYQKQYRREGQRATQNALAQAAGLTGGQLNSWAQTAAGQTGNYYASQLSDKLPELYQDAYNRYLQEFQRQLGISDQYQGFDDREYSRWADQQGRNINMADRYNQYGNTEYQRYLDQLGQYNTDRNFSYGRYRDAVGDYRYDDETQYNRAWNEENRDYTRNYQTQRDAISDARYDQQWAQQLREYADAQGWKQAEWNQYLREYGDQLSEKERQWAYQMARDAVSDARYDREYADSRSDTAYDRALREDELAYDRAWNEDEREYERGWDTTKWNQALREYDDEQAQQAWNNEYKLSGKSGSGSGSGYSGGGSNTTKTANGDLPKGQYRQGGYTYLSDKTHPQGQPMTAMYEQAYQDTWDKWQSGMDYALLLAEIKELVINKTVTDYEGEMILRDLRKWKEQGRQVDASKGGGGGGTRTQMTR